MTVPVNTFANNFDAGSPTIVLDESLFNYSMIAGPWNDPPVGWSEIPLTTPFTYNFSDNLAIQFEYSGINYPIPLYADNGGIPLTILTNVYDSLIANSSTARMMIGFSTSPPSPIAIAASDSAVCQKFCVDFTDFSNNNPTAWEWNFEGGTPSSSSDQNPAGICYNLPGTYDVSLITTNANGSDTLTLPDYITVYATPPFPTITQNGYILTSSPAGFYQWQLNAVEIPGATNQSYTVLQSGLYTVIVGDSNGCINSASKDVLLTGIEEVRDPSVSIYPNPSTGDFTVELLNQEITREVLINVSNTLGQKVFSSSESGFTWSTAHFKKQVDLRKSTSCHISPGVYFIEIKVGNAFVRKKITIANHYEK